MAFIPWHDHQPGIKGAFERWQASKTSANLKALSKLFDKALDTKYVKQQGSLLVEMNDHGRSYSCMDQADMGTLLITAGIATGNKQWINKGVSCLEVLVTPYNKGGLRTRMHGTSWIHGKTTRISNNPGGTLNKHLTAARDLCLMSTALNTIGRRSKAKDFKALSIEAVKQLANPKAYPNLLNFVVKKKGVPVTDSWMYYAIRYNQRQPYHLKYEPKNGVYHVFVLRLIRTLHGLLGSDFPLAELKALKVGDTNIVRWFLEIYKSKAATGIHSDSNSVVGSYTGIPVDKPILSSSDLAYLESTY